jgi:hypothetical protein
MYMFRKTDDRFYPNSCEVDLMSMLSKGNTLINIADKISVPDSTIRKRFENLRINLGVNTNAQMMFELGKVVLLNTLEQFAANENSEMQSMIKKFRYEYLPALKDLVKAALINCEKLPDEQEM